MSIDHRAKKGSLVPGPDGRSPLPYRLAARGAILLAASLLFSACLPAGEKGVQEQKAEPKAGKPEVQEVKAQESESQAPKKAYGANCFEGDCHSDLKARKVLHGPLAVMACNTCHKPEEGEEHGFELARDEEELCTFCHVLPAPGKVLHKPYEQKGCLYCHDPHGGDSRPLLVKGEGPGGPCAECHERSKEEHVHRPYAEGNCSACHVSHQSDEAGLLRKPEKVLCSSCHDAMAKALKSAGKLHDPVEKGKCGSCHAAHASAQPGLLSAAYSREFYEAYDSKKYELCLGCHAPEIFSTREGGKGGFLDGTRNLHFVHVNSAKGHTCKVCHPVHASPGPELKKLIHREVPFGDWKLPIGFQEAPGGGKCASGCHKEAAYVRSPTPAEPPAVEEPKPTESETGKEKSP